MALKYRNQPLRTLYTIGAASWILLRIPFWAARNIVPALRPRRNWPFVRALMVEIMDAAISIMLETGIPPVESLESLAANAKTTGFVWIEPPPDHLILGDIKRIAELNSVLPARVGGCWYGVRGSDNQFGGQAAPGEKVFYLLHGGGSVMGSSASSFAALASISQGLLEHNKHVSRLFASEYRLSAGPPLPVLNPFPAALIDVLAGYHYLVHQLNFSPENVIVVGDSAGGKLAYQLVRYCSQYNALLPSGAFPVPGALLLLSPSVDSGLHPIPDSSMVTNARSDYLRSWYASRYSVLSLLGSLPESELDGPWLSPGSAVLQDDDAERNRVFKSFPRTMIVTGEAEMARDSMRILRDRMVEAMGEEHVRYLEVDNAPHDFIAGSMWEPERTIALREIALWAISLVSKA